MFACAERVTGLSWSLLISYQQQNLLVHEILDTKPGCSNGQSQIFPSYWFTTCFASQQPVSCFAAFSSDIRELDKEIFAKSSVT